MIIKLIAWRTTLFIFALTTIIYGSSLIPAFSQPSAFPSSFDVSNITVTTLPSQNNAWTGGGTLTTGPLRFSLVEDFATRKTYRSNIPSTWSYSGSWTQGPVSIAETGGPGSPQPLQPIFIHLNPSNNTFYVQNINFQYTSIETSSSGTSSNQRVYRLGDGGGLGGTVVVNSSSLNFSQTINSFCYCGVGGYISVTTSGFLGVDSSPTPTPTPTPNSTLTATVQTNPAGRTFTVDGTTYSSNQTFTWQSGAAHTISTNSPQTASNGTQYVWSNWSDGGAISHTVSPTGNVTYTANFTTPLPVVTDVIREFPGFFLTGFDKTNNFDVRVDWKGTAGKVRFQINNDTPFEVAGTSTGAIKAFNLKNDFPASYAPSTIKITPINGGSTVGETKTEVIYVFPYTPWLQTAISENPEALTFTPVSDEIRSNFKVKFPNRPLDAVVLLPDWIPMVGRGNFGIRNTQGIFEGYVSSKGSGSLKVGGQSIFTGFGRENTQSELEFKVTGNGEFRLNENGLSVYTASFNLGGSLDIKKEFGVTEAFPVLQPLNRFKFFKEFSNIAKLQVKLKTFADLKASWKQIPNGELKFDEATGKVGLKFEASPQIKISKDINLKHYVSGGGEIEVRLPVDNERKFLRGINFTFETGYEIKFQHLFENKSSIAYTCALLNSADTPSCFSNGSSNRFEKSFENESKLKLIKNNYKRFGNYEFLKQDSDSKEESSNSSLPANENPILSNVFPGAEPNIIPTGNNSRLLIWVKQNPNLPVMRSTDIAWSYFDGMSWSQPAIITADTRAEFSPVVGVDTNGKVVAAWLKIKNPAFNTPISTIDDLPLFYKQVEVVSAVFDPITRTWSSEKILTDDLAFDTSLRLASDSSGKLLLTWQSNPSGEFVTDNNGPATLKYSFWNGSSWNAPAIVANNLSNISEHTVAIKNNNAFIVVPYDPNPDATNDSKLITYKWNGANWSQGNFFAEGAVDNLIPQAAYDTTGEGQIVWRQGADLVQANLTNPIPRIVREASESSAFFGFRLINNEQNKLTIIWHEEVNNGSANIFTKIYSPASNTWGGDRRLNQDEWQSKDTNGYYDARGNLQLVYLATQITRITETVTINGQSYQIPNIPKDGQTDLRLLTVNQTKTIFDFDGDGRADVSVFRPSNGTWYLNQSTNGFAGMQFGIPTDKIVPADFDGDGKTDIAVFRNGVWYLQRSQLGFTGIQFGTSGDVPQPADFDGDGKADIAVFRPSNGTWYLLQSTAGFTGIQFGQNGDRPVAADFDGDGKSDIAVYRNGVWYLNRSQLGFTGLQFGEANDKPVPADYDGDGKTDVAVFRPSNGTWYLQRSQIGFTGVQFGISMDLPAPADYDDDGKADVAVFRDGVWYLNRSTQGFTGVQFGTANDKPIPNAFVQ